MTVETEIGFPIMRQNDGPSPGCRVRQAGDMSAPCAEQGYCWAGAAGGVAGAGVAGAGAGVALLSVGAIGLAGAGWDWVVEAVVSGDVPGGVLLHCE